MNIASYKIPVGHWTEECVNWIMAHFGSFFQYSSHSLDLAIKSIEHIFLVIPAPVLILLLALAAWRLSGWRTAIMALLGLALVDNMSLWTPIVKTLSLVVCTEILVLIIGFPLGILAANSEVADRILRPVMDFAQTMPTFVYLIPAVMLFGLGLVPAMIATLIFALPPLIRLTCLGIRQVPDELIEAAEAFGSTWWQMLIKVQLPVAIPAVLTGLNQSIMMALSMVVISSMIGAGGIGSNVLDAISTLKVGDGFEAGIAVVILAMVLDRITQGMGLSHKPSK